MAYQCLAGSYSEFFGIPHITSIVKLIGSRSLPLIIRALLDHIAVKVGSLRLHYHFLFLLFVFNYYWSALYNHFWRRNFAMQCELSTSKFSIWFFHSVQYLKLVFQFLWGDFINNFHGLICSQYTKFIFLNVVYFL